MARRVRRHDLNRLKIFISSRMEELQAERDAVETGISTLRFEPVRAETIGAQPKSPRETCLEAVRDCDVYIAICGSRYGSIPAGQEVSVTEMEFLEARDCEKDILIYVQKGAKREHRQQEFVRRLEDFDEGYFRGSFSTPEELAIAVQNDLSSLVSAKFRVARDFALGTDASLQLQQQHAEQIAAIDELRAQLETLAQRLPEREPKAEPGEVKDRASAHMAPSVGDLPTEQLMRMGADAESEGLLDTALGFYEAVLARDPNDPSALQASAWTRYGMYDYEGALSRINKARKLAPAEQMPLIEARRACILAEFGHILVENDMVREALDVFESLPDRLLTDDSLLYNTGNCLWYLGDREGAITHYERALSGLRGDSGHEGLHSMIWVNLGRCHEGIGNLARARECFDEAVRIDASNWKAYVGLASLALQKGEHADAVSAMEMAWKYVEPYDACRKMALEWRVASLAQARNAEEIWRVAGEHPEITARSDYIQRLLPGVISTLWRESAGYVKQALEFYLKRTQESPEDESAWLELFTLRVQLGEDGEAADVADRAIAGGYASAELRHQYGHLLHRMGRSEDAISQLEKAAELAPSHHHSHCLALLCLEMKDYEKAAMRFEEARKDAIDVVGILRSLGYCYFQLGDVAQAKRAMEDLVALEPDSAAAWNNLGVCYRQLGMLEEASQAFARSEECAREEHGEQPEHPNGTTLA
jgi:tetratricopeptide (TPR) repeat protein